MSMRLHHSSEAAGASEAPPARQVDVEQRHNNFDPSIDAPFDPASFQYNHHRHYDPTPGRWQSEDPIGYEADDENLQKYVGR